MQCLLERNEMKSFRDWRQILKGKNTTEDCFAAFLDDVLNTYLTEYLTLYAKYS